MGLGVWLYEVTQLAAPLRVEGSGETSAWSCGISRGDSSFVGRWNQLGGVVRGAGPTGMWCGVR